MLGQIIVSASDAVPKGYHLADGTWLKESDYFALYNEIGTLYNNHETKFGMFRLPDCRGRVVIGMGAAPPLTFRKIGTIGGVEEVVLTEQQMPEHSHASTASTVIGGSEGSGPGLCPGGRYKCTQITCTGPQSNLYPTASAGGNQPLQNMQPFITMNVLIYIGEKTLPKCVLCCTGGDIWCRSGCCGAYYCKTCSIQDKNCAQCGNEINNFSLV